MKKRIPFLGLFVTLAMQGIAQSSSLPQLLKQAHEAKGKPNSHLYVEIARAWLSTNPDSTIKYADAAARMKPQGADLIHLEAARGEALLAKGETEKALKHFTQARSMAERQHNTSEKFNQMCSMGICLSRLQKFDEAQKLYEQVVNYGIKHSRKLAFSGYQNYGVLCSRIGRTADCEKMLRNALKYEDAADDVSLRVSVYSGLGSILTYNPQTFGEAEKFLRQGMDIARKAHEPLAEANCISPLISLLTQIPNRYDEIPGLITRADAIVKGAAPSGSERMQLEHAKANYYFVTKQWKLALQSALMLYENGPAVSSERDKVMLMTARAYEGVGQTERACYFYREAYYIGDSIHQLNVQQQAADAAARYDAKEKELKIANLQKVAAQNEAHQWRLTAWLVALCIVLIALCIGVMQWRRHLKRKFELAEAKRYIDGLENERKRLAQELHDGICNDLLVAEMQLSSTDDVKEAARMLNTARGDIRHISHELMPPNMQFASLSQMLQAYAFKLADMKKAKTTFEYDKTYDWSLLPQQIGYQLYRITQELVSNLMKHGKPSYLRIALHHTAENFTELCIESDGLPAKETNKETNEDTNSKTNNKDNSKDNKETNKESNNKTNKEPRKDSTSDGIGLRSIRERIKSLSAEINIDGQKVCIRCSENMKEVSD